MKSGGRKCVVIRMADTGRKRSQDEEADRHNAAVEARQAAAAAAQAAIEADPYYCLALRGVAALEKIATELAAARRDG
jgi:hypothetical protein